MRNKERISMLNLTEIDWSWLKLNKIHNVINFCHSSKQENIKLPHFFERIIKIKLLFESYQIKVIRVKLWEVHCALLSGRFVIDTFPFSSLKGIQQDWKGFQSKEAAQTIKKYEGCRKAVNQEFLNVDPK